MPPKISIVTVTCNAGLLLEKTFASIEKLKYDNKELIVVDGLSTDNTMAIIKRYSERGIITSYVSERDNGIYDAMNKGVRMCSGEWVIFMNAGDAFASDDVLQRVFSGSPIEAD
ncbi:MAG TPA: glycosyltransferase, partial [Parabacteroides sp.]|nr:glycosyltransferase [Parabacteroides sp.]